jgi:TolB protein
VSILEQTDTPERFRYRVHRLIISASELVALTPGPMDLWSSWAPDGGHIAYASRVDRTSDIFVMRADGSNPTRLTDDPADDTQPDWSPDGAHIAFISRREGTEQVYVMKADGSEQVRIGAAERDAQNPDWSPDGKRIAYYETDSTGLDEIYVINADGTARRRLALGVWPHWSPDGSKLLFGAPGGLSTISVDGTSESMLVAGAQFGAFSPDGRRIGYIIAANGQVSVHVVNSDGSRSVRLLTRPAPKW